MSQTSVYKVGPGSSHVHSEGAQEKPQSVWLMEEVDLVWGSVEKGNGQGGGEKRYDMWIYKNKGRDIVK